MIGRGGLWRVKAAVLGAELLCLALIGYRAFEQRAAGGTQGWYLLLVLALVPLHLQRLEAALRDTERSLELGLATALEALALASLKGQELSLFAFASSLVALWVLASGSAQPAEVTPEEKNPRRVLRALRSILYLMIATALAAWGSSHGTSALSSVALALLACAPLLRLQPCSKLAWLSVAVLPHGQLLIPRGTHSVLLGLLIALALIWRFGSKRGVRSVQCLALVAGLWSGWVAEYPCRTPSGRIPIVHVGTSLEVPYPVLSIGTFQPLFGPAGGGEPRKGAACRTLAALLPRAWGILRVPQRRADQASSLCLGAQLVRERAGSEPA